MATGMESSGGRTRPSMPGRVPVPPHHPVFVRIDAERAADFQLRLADRITAFAGSMPFVYIHAIAFGIWMLLFEKSPWPTLTLVVSLEAIFLSTFVMIGQNRQAAFQQAKADHDFAGAGAGAAPQHRADARHPSTDARHASRRCDARSRRTCCWRTRCWRAGGW